MNITSINPTTGKILKEFPELTPTELTSKLDGASAAFKNWKKTSFEERRELLLKVAEILRSNKAAYARIMALEMGKRLEDGMAEIEKSAKVCEYYAQNAAEMLKTEIVPTEAQESLITFEPLGVILAVMPWNFPFWQVFRCAAPAIMAGNSVVLKHASNVPESALAIQEVFSSALAPAGLFQTLLISSAQVPGIISDPRVRMVSLTGSEAAGASVASLAAKHIKKAVLELGGSDAFIVLDDADVAKAAEAAATSRMIVSGQSCIAAKRFIVAKSMAPKFIELFKQNLEQKKLGDPLDPTTGVGPLSSAQAVVTIDHQVTQSIKLGAKLITGGKKPAGPGFFYPPTILTQVTEEMPVMVEETFGPVAAVMVVKDDVEALRVANNSRYGLGASVWTKSLERANYFISNLEVGAVFVNTFVKSDQRMPFGGAKFSGFGKELSVYGLKEFVQFKTVWIEPV